MTGLRGIQCVCGGGEGWVKNNESKGQRVTKIAEVVSSRAFDNMSLGAHPTLIPNFLLKEGTSAFPFWDQCPTWYKHFSSCSLILSPLLLKVLLSEGLSSSRTGILPCPLGLKGPQSLSLKPWACGYTPIAYCQVQLLRWQEFAISQSLTLHLHCMTFLSWTPTL